MLDVDIQVCLILPGLYYTGFNQVMFENKYKNMSIDSPYGLYEIDNSLTINIASASSTFWYNGVLNINSCVVIYHIFVWISLAIAYEQVFDEEISFVII